MPSIPDAELQKVLYTTEKEERKDETFADALVHNLRNLRKGNKVPFHQEVVIGVPYSLIEENKNGSKDFITACGKISRDESLHLPIGIKTEVFERVDGETENMINIIAKYTDDTDINAVEHYFNK